MQKQPALRLASISGGVGSASRIRGHLEAGNAFSLLDDWNEKRCAAAYGFSPCKKDGIYFADLRPDGDSLFPCEDGVFAFAVVFREALDFFAAGWEDSALMASSWERICSASTACFWLQQVLLREAALLDLFNVQYRPLAKSIEKFG
jgi:hypothetical protein